MNTENGFFVELIKATAKTLLAFLYGIYGGWVISVLWGWFAVAILGMPPITVSMAIAILILRGLIFSGLHDLKMSTAIDNINKETKASNNLLDWVGYPILYTVCLVSGATWHFVLFPLLAIMGVS